MPRLPIDYSNTIIYMLVCNDVTIKDLYVGHTTNFTNRKRAHKKKCNNKNDKGYNVYVYQFIRNNGGWDNWTMLEICNLSCKTKQDALRTERKYIEDLKATLNKRNPILEPDEKIINEINKNKKYYAENKEQIIVQHREYQNNNTDHLTEYHHQYYQNHPEKKEKSKTIILCECGLEYTYNHKSRHLLSKIHIKKLSL